MFRVARVQSPQICCKYIRDNYPDLLWAIGGRNKEKLQQIKSDFNLNCDVIEADGADMEALKLMSSQTKVVLSTAGPFARYGSLLVQACVEEGSHYTDITGENHWVKGLIDKHHEEAASKGIRIIPSCGYDSIPSDIGAFFTISYSKPPLRQSLLNLLFWPYKVLKTCFQNRQSKKSTY